MLRAVGGRGRGSGRHAGVATGELRQLEPAVTGSAGRACLLVDSGRSAINPANQPGLRWASIPMEVSIKHGSSGFIHALYYFSYCVGCLGCRWQGHKVPGQISPRSRFRLGNERRSRFSVTADQNSFPPLNFDRGFWTGRGQQFSLWDEWDEWDEWRMIIRGLEHPNGWTPNLPDQPK